MQVKEACTPELRGTEASSKDLGLAGFDDFAVDSGPSGSYHTYYTTNYSGLDYQTPYTAVQVGFACSTMIKARSRERSCADTKARNTGGRSAVTIREVAVHAGELGGV